MKRKHIHVIGLLVIFLASFVVFFSNSTLQYLFPEKIWSHKTNSIHKLNQANSIYSGVELDVVFDKGRSFFDIYHPPEESKGLSLSTYLKNRSISTRLKYWLDFKNLSEENQIFALNHLDSLISEGSLNKSNIIIESTNICLLTLFKENGYATSYYLPSNIYKLKKNEREAIIAKIRLAISACPQTYISTEYTDYELISKYFPQEEKLFWFTVYAGINSIKARMLLFKILSDEKVDALLVPFDPDS